MMHLPPNGTSHISHSTPLHPSSSPTTYLYIYLPLLFKTDIPHDTAVATAMYSLPLAYLHSMHASQTSSSKSVSTHHSASPPRQPQTHAVTHIFLCRHYVLSHNAPIIFQDTKPTAHFLTMHTPNKISNMSLRPHPSASLCPGQQLHMLTALLLARPLVPCHITATTPSSSR